ncbi:Lrp/AsnC family transcriptional regulator [Haloprofundus salinisoli]|uniref:Lrp/AsnC family transcriptional regulator n=1 Tax=Haloprofundus salinisoli TaxID=2876193 RepID=UPI001CCD0B17|nr:Lrp/AsnC family transcriptional regulator [Haloprofundus salinisoli]
MSRELDDLDRYIIYALQGDARGTTAREIAEMKGVSASTVRNRIHRLEDGDIIRGSHLDIDFEAAGYQLYTLILCTAPIPKREQLAREACNVDGVVSVREIMTGGENVHITVVGEDSDDLSRIGRDLSSLGFEIVEEELIRNEYTCPYTPFSESPDE